MFHYLVKQIEYNFVFRFILKLVREQIIEFLSSLYCQFFSFDVSWSLNGFSEIKKKISNAVIWSTGSLFLFLFGFLEQSYREKLLYIIYFARYSGSKVIALDEEMFSCFEDFLSNEV